MGRPLAEAGWRGQAERQGALRAAWDCPGPPGRGSISSRRSSGSAGNLSRRSSCFEKDISARHLSARTIARNSESGT